MVGVARTDLSTSDKIAARQPDDGIMRQSSRPGKVDDAIANQTAWSFMPSPASICRFRAIPPPSTRCMSKQLTRTEDQRATPAATRLFYLATPPNAFAPISRKNSAAAGLLKRRKRRRGGVWWSKSHSAPIWLPPSRAQRRIAHSVVDEQQIYRIDHYPRQGDRSEHPGVCALPTACSSRSGTAITSITCRSRWTNKLGVGHRGSFYDADRRACATWCRIICSNCCRWWRWSLPIRFDAHAVRSEKAEVLAAIQTQSEKPMR